MHYLIPTEGRVIFEEEIKKSRFITYLKHTEGIECARKFWQQIRNEHPKARHHCWAAVASSPTNSMQLGFSDDGEPNGTAGKPMLNQLLGSRIGEISAVVVRYYGGILLGTGGLVKAYSHGVQQALQQLQTTYKVFRTQASIHCDYVYISLIQQLCEQLDGVIVSQAFHNKVIFQLAIKNDNIGLFQQQLKNCSAGQVLLNIHQASELSVDKS